MQGKEITIRVTFTRDQLTGTKNPAGNEVLAGQVIMGALRKRGVPVIGVLGLLGVEWGTLTCAQEDGLDGDEWTWTWTGVKMPPTLVDKYQRPGHRIKLESPLSVEVAALAAAEDDEL